ncbi:MAG: amidohydrolase [Acidobacteriota bacterium]|nr:MAG: amidohydrolase [Acidobacteriota bacterium]
MRLSRWAALAAGLAWVAACDARESVDTILYHGNIVTLDGESTIAEAIAVRGDRIVAVGTDEEILAFAAAARIDLEGKTVVPGFADNHYHSIGGGPGVDLSRTRSLSDVFDAIAAGARETPEGEVIVTNSDWHEGQLAEQRLPYRDDLDEATSTHPVVVVRGGHLYLLNSAALAKWGIDESVTSPEGGSFGRYPDGRLNGELVDTAKSVVELPPPPRTDRVDFDALAAELRRLNEVGLTSIRYGSADQKLFGALTDLHARGDLGVRVSALLRITPAIAPDELEQTIGGWNVEPDDGDEWLRVAGIKLGVDGGFEGGWMREPYEEPWGENGTYYGLQTYPSEQFIETVRELNRLGWRVGTHAVGDAAIDLVLDGYEKAHADESLAGKRWAIEHGFIPRDDQLERMRELELHVTAQHHLYLAAPSLVKYWGPERTERVTPVRTYLDAGIPVSLGTDSPVVPYPPLWVLYHFITRDTISAGVMGEDQKISREEALRAMTLGNAELTFEEDIKGSLEPGKLADLVVLSDDILTCAPERIRDMDVMMTIVGGEIVFERAPEE